MDGIIAPPWLLTGSGYIFLFRFPREFVLSEGFLSPDLAERYQGGFGSVMLVDYHTSGVGPYRELLFIPGQFLFGGTRRYSITKIFVSTIASVVNGQENWGIPKELADFQIQPTHNNADRIVISRDGQVFFDMTVRGFGPKLPIASRLAPLNLSIGQEFEGKMFTTRPYASGWVSLAQIIRKEVKPLYFPDIGRITPLLVLRASGFKMSFPTPQTRLLRQEQVLDHEGLR